MKISDKKNNKLKDKIAIVTGASGGIGSEIVKLLDENGVLLVLTDVNIKALNEIAKNLSKEHLVIQCDITKIEQVKDLISQTIKKYGTIDILVNTVGIIIPALFEDTTYEDIEKQVNVNLIGTIFCTKEVIPIMKKAGKGNIITLSSLAGIVPETYSSIYTATKFALRGLNFTLNLELKKHDIIVSTIFPDSVDTPMLEFEAKHGGSGLTFLDDPVKPEDVAKLVIKAILKEKVELYIPHSQGRLLKFVMCFPKLVQRLWPKFEEKGEKKKQEYLKSLENSI